MHKVAGAAAAAGLSLEEVKAEAEKCAAEMGSFGEWQPGQHGEQQVGSG